MSQDGSKIYVLDTTVLEHDAECIENLSRGNTVIIPGPVLQELSDHTHDSKFVEYKRYLAQRANQTIGLYFPDGTPMKPEGVETKSGGRVAVIIGTEREHKLPTGFDSRQRDNQILLVVKFTLKEFKKRGDKRRVILISKDLSLRHRAKAMGIDAEDYRSDKVDNFMSSLASGVASLRLSEGSSSLLTQLYRNGNLELSDVVKVISAEKLQSLYENQCVFLTLPDGKSAQAIFKKQQGSFNLVTPCKEYVAEKKRAIMPRNEMQAFAMALLKDTSIGILTIAGVTGSGKTLLILDWAYDQITGNPNGSGPRNGYQQIIVFRSNVEAGNKLGFLPGDVDEKFAPYKSPIYHTLDYITRHRQREKGADNHRDNERDSIARHLEENGQLIITPPNFSRGDTYHNSIIILDDAQNTNLAVVQLLLSRAGENSRVIINGDPTQIDDPHLDPASCGLVQVAVEYRGEPDCACIYLPGSERSRIAELSTRLIR